MKLGILSIENIDKITHRDSSIQMELINPNEYRIVWSSSILLDAMSFKPKRVIKRMILSRIPTDVGYLMISDEKQMVVRIEDIKNIDMFIRRIYQMIN
jgi:hypothetical protein